MAAASADRDESAGPVSGHEDPSLVYVIGRVNQGIRREMRLRLKAYELSVPEYTTLSVLRSRPGLSNAQLSRRALITPQAMLEVLAKLEERGLVQRDVDPAHGRILRAELTPAGERALHDADPEIEALQEDLLAGVPARQRDALFKGLLSTMGKLSSGLSAPELR
jgi:DNA-binding MarR family transcriptional regulator